MLSSTVTSDPLLFGCGLWAAGTPPSKDLPGTTSDRSRTRKEDSVGATLSKLSAPDLRRPNGTENRGMRAAGQEDPYQKKLTQKPPVRSGLGGAAVFFLPRCCRQPDCRSGERGVEFLERDTMSRRCREGSTKWFGDFVSGISTAGRDVGQLYDCESKKSVGLLLLAGM